MSTATFSGVVVEGGAVEVLCDPGRRPVVWEHVPDGSARHHQAKTMEAAIELAEFIASTRRADGETVTVFIDRSAS